MNERNENKNEKEYENKIDLENEKKEGTASTSSTQAGTGKTDSDEELTTFLTTQALSVVFQNSLDTIEDTTFISFLLINKNWGSKTIEMVSRLWGPIPSRVGAGTQTATVSAGAGASTSASASASGELQVEGRGSQQDVLPLFKVFVSQVKKIFPPAIVPKTQSRAPSQSRATTKHTKSKRTTSSTSSRASSHGGRKKNSADVKVTPPPPTITPPTTTPTIPSSSTTATTTTCSSSKKNSLPPEWWLSIPRTLDAPEEWKLLIHYQKTVEFILTQEGKSNGSCIKPGLSSFAYDFNIVMDSNLDSNLPEDKLDLNLKPSLFDRILVFMLFYHFIYFKPGPVSGPGIKSDEKPEAGPDQNQNQIEKNKIPGPFDKLLLKYSDHLLVYFYILSSVVFSSVPPPEGKEQCEKSGTFVEGKIRRLRQYFEDRRPGVASGRDQDLGLLVEKEKELKIKNRDEDVLERPFGWKLKKRRGL